MAEKDSGLMAWTSGSWTTIENEKLSVHSCYRKDVCVFLYSLVNLDDSWVYLE